MGKNVWFLFLPGYNISFLSKNTTWERLWWTNKGLEIHQIIFLDCMNVSETIQGNENRSLWTLKSISVPTRYFIETHLALGYWNIYFRNTNWGRVESFLDLARRRVRDSELLEAELWSWLPALPEFSPSIIIFLKKMLSNSSSLPCSFRNHSVISPTEDQRPSPAEHDHGRKTTPWESVKSVASGKIGFSFPKWGRQKVWSRKTLIF